MAPSRAGLALIRLAAARPTTASLTSPIAIPHHLFARRSLFSSSSLPQIRCCSRSRSRSSFRAAPLAPRLGSSPQNNHTPIAIGTAKANVPREAVHGCRAYSSSSSSSSPVEPPDYLDDKEKAIFETLREALGPTALEVQDISGGCGSMYAINVTSAKFSGLPVIKQHRLVNEILEEQIKTWHGIQLKTKAP